MDNGTPLNDGNGAFSTITENLQVVWDATSFKQLQFCPRSYQLGILQGWRGSAVDLEFGIMFATSTEVYAKARLAGSSKEEASELAIARVVAESWKDGPWGGYYENEWHCDGTTPYRNPKGNRAKCPYSFKGKWFIGTGPDTCGQCGSCTRTERHYLPVDKVKNRRSLIQLVAWYCEEQPDDPSVGGLFPYAFPDGTPAIELSFKLPLPWSAPTGETYVLAGHMDGIKTFGSEPFVTDNKTTKTALNALYWKQYNPNTQVDIYDLVGSLLYPSLGIRGVVIEAAQTLATGARFASHPFYRTEGQRSETLRDLEFWLRQAEKFVADDYWPMNKTNCKFCAFNGICSKDPAQRERFLNADFVRNRWDPTKER